MWAGRGAKRFTHSDSVKLHGNPMRSVFLCPHFTNKKARVWAGRQFAQHHPVSDNVRHSASNPHTNADTHASHNENNGTALHKCHRCANRPAACLTEVHLGSRSQVLSLHSEGPRYLPNVTPLVLCSANHRDWNFHSYHSPAVLCSSPAREPTNSP